LFSVLLIKSFWKWCRCQDTSDQDILAPSDWCRTVSTSSKHVLLQQSCRRKVYRNITHYY